MSDTVSVNIPLTRDVARALILSVAPGSSRYAVSWDWWRSEATAHKVYTVGNVEVKLEQVVDPSYTYNFDESQTYDVQMVFSLQVQSVEWETSKDAIKFYRIDGEFSSYGGGEWDERSFREVRPTEKVIREYV